MKESLNREVVFDNKKSIEVLGLKYEDLRRAIIDMVLTMFEKG
jgi:hypothetical protein